VHLQEDAVLIESRRQVVIDVFVCQDQTYL
jgi:hypothetical protein